MDLTTNYSLKKPSGADVVNIDDFNYNADTIDTKIKVIEEQSNANKIDIASNTTLINNYKNRTYDGTIDTKSLDYIIKNYNSGCYYVLNCTGFPYDWGGLQILKYGDTGSGCLIFHNLEHSIGSWGTYINYYRSNGSDLKGWKKIANDSDVASLQKYKLTNDYGYSHKFFASDTTNLDLNNIIQCGFYSLDEAKNTPSTYIHLLVVGNESFSRQIAFAVFSDAMWTRTYINGTWGTWKQISVASTFSLEQQVSELEIQATENEKKISILEQNNKELREELNQIQTSIAALITTTIEKQK